MIIAFHDIYMKLPLLQVNFETCATKVAIIDVFIIL